MIRVNQTHVVVSLGNALHVASKSCLYEFTELNFLSVGFQLPPSTSNILTDCLIKIVSGLVTWAMLTKASKLSLLLSWLS